MHAQRIRALSLVFSLIAALVVAAPQALEAQTTVEPAAETAPGEASTPAPEQAEQAATEGTLHIVLFAVDGSSAAGARVTLVGGPSGISDSVGSLQLLAPTGDYEVEVLFPADSAPKRVEGVVIAADKVTEVIASARPDGTLEADVMLPAGVEAAAEAEVQAEQPAAKAPGTLHGKVVGAEDGTAVLDASIFVAGQQAEAKTDAEGRFEIALPEGSHILSVIHPKYSTQTVRDVAIQSEKRTDITVELTPVAIELQDFVVTAPHISGGVASMIEERKSSAAMSDAIGAEDIAKLPANDAAQAAQRIVGATIVGGRFVYVRGLGERYSNALLNGAPLPSPEPDRAAVPLDLFPSQILESLDISKTFTPDVPGDFAGGSVRVTTRDIPEKTQFAVSLGTSANTASTLRQSWGQKASSTDFLGFDDGMRGQPDVPTDYRLVRAEQRPDGTRVGRDELSEAAKRFKTPLYPERKTNLPNVNGSIAYGDRWDLGKNVKLGVLASLIYRRDYKYKDETFKSYQPDALSDTGVQLLQDYTSETTTHAVRWGAFGSSALTIGDEHKISILGMRSQLADARTRLLGGSNTFKNADVRTIRMDYLSRALTFGQLQGLHKLHLFNNAEMRWLGAIARAESDEGDTRDTVFQRDLTMADGPYNFIADNGSGRHYYAGQFENAYTAGLDWKQPVLEDWFGLELKAGTLVSSKNREFRARNFTSELSRDAGPGASSCLGGFDPVRCPTSVFGGDALGSSITLSESTRPQDAYNAELGVYAGYLMGTVSFGEQWKVSGGARLEQTDQVLELFNPFTGQVIEPDPDKPEDPLRGADLHQLDVLPALALIYSPVEELNLRASGTITLARPQLRELAPFPYTEYYGGPAITGNPQLKLTRIQNLDLRAEYFPSSREILAFSLFAKNFVNPIEKLQIPSSEGFAEKFENSPGALLLGAELEVRHSLDFMHDALDHFSFLGSLMLARSEIDVSGLKNEDFLTNKSRPMMQSSPWVVQAAIDYDDDDGFQFRVLYFSSGAKVVAVGTEGVPDTYEHPQHSLDFTISQRLGEHFRVKGNVRNILNTEVLATIGNDRDGPVYTKFREGATVSVSLTYNN